MTIKTYVPMHIGVTPDSLDQKGLIGDFRRRPNTEKGGTDYLGGLINYNPPQGQTGAERLGLFGAALRDASAYFQGRPQLAGSLDNAIAEHRRRLQLLHETALAAQRRRAAQSAMPNAGS